MTEQRPTYHADIAGLATERRRALLYAALNDAGAAEAIVAKNRDGATGSVGLYWNAELSMFGNAAQVQL